MNNLSNVALSDRTETEKSKSFCQIAHQSKLEIYTLIFMGGISNGLPGVLTWQSLNLWLYQLGYSKTIIGTVFIASIPYNCKFLLSPVVEFIKIPYLSDYFGRKRSWALVSQFFVMLSLIGIAFATNGKTLSATIFFCFLTSIFSTLNQIATVSHRIEFFDDKYKAMGISVGITGYRIGKLIGRAGALYLIYFLSWEATYCLFSTILLLSMIAYSSRRDIDENVPQKTLVSRRINILLKPFPTIKKFKFLSIAFVSLYYPFIQFKKTFENWRLILLFILTVNLGDDMILGWTDIFLTDIGFSKITIANTTKFFGLVCSLSGGIAAASMCRKYSMYRLLLVSISFHFLSHLLLIYLSQKGPQLELLVFIVALEYLSLGMKAALIATLTSYLARQSTTQTGTQYALFSSIKATPLLLLSIAGGFIQENTSWTIFYTMSALLTLPSIYILYKLSDKLELYFPTDNVKEHLAVSMKAR